MKKILIIILTAIAVKQASPAQAQTCTMLPTCEELGYTKSEADCNGKSFIRCPLNKGKVYCEEGKVLTSCPAGYADIDIIRDSCSGSNARLVFADESLKCAKCQTCGNHAYLEKITGCCPDILYGKDVDGCTNSTGYGTTTIYNIKGSDGCWTCSKCRNTYTLNQNGNCIAN